MKKRLVQLEIQTVAAVLFLEAATIVLGIHQKHFLCTFSFIRQNIKEMYSSVEI